MSRFRGRFWRAGSGTEKHLLRNVTSCNKTSTFAQLGKAPVEWPNTIHVVNFHSARFSCRFRVDNSVERGARCSVLQQLNGAAVVPTPPLAIAAAWAPSWESEAARGVAGPDPSGSDGLGSRFCRWQVSVHRGNAALDRQIQPQQQGGEASDLVKKTSRKQSDNKCYV